MRRTRCAVMTGQKKTAWSRIVFVTLHVVGCFWGVRGEKVCMCVSSVAIEAAVTGPQCKGGRTPGRVGDVQGSSMHNENPSSVRSACASLGSL